MPDRWNLGNMDEREKTPKLLQHLTAPVP